MSLLAEPKARQLLDEATLAVAAVRHGQEHLTEFLQHYLPHFYRHEQRAPATLNDRA